MIAVLFFGTCFRPPCDQSGRNLDHGTDLAIDEQIMMMCQ